MDHCSSCTTSTACTSCYDGFALKSPPNGCLTCSSNCKTCVTVYNQCTDCNYPGVLQADKTCLDTVCPTNQYPNSLLGCKNCIDHWPNAASCNNV